MAFVRGRGEGGAAVRRGTPRAGLQAARERRHVRRDTCRVDDRGTRLLQTEHTWLVSLTHYISTNL